MTKNIITIAGILCMTISCAFAYTEPECTLPIDVFQEYVKTSGSNCDPSKITKIAYYSNYRGWMVIGESGNSNKCLFKFKSDNNTNIDNAILGGGSCGTLSTYTILTSQGVSYACANNSDCDTANGWVCSDINSTYGIGICTQTSCGSNCTVGYGSWRTATGYPAYEERVVTQCNKQTDTTYKNYYCSHTPEARCAKGAYGTNPKAAPYSGCTSCPPDTKYNATPSTAGAGATAVTECYLPKDVLHTDATGTFKFTENCKYTN